MWDWFQQYCPWVLRGLAVVYGRVGKIRRMVYQHGWLKVHHLPKPVVSVGNITVGGTGKTPFVIWLAHQLHRKGKRVAILSRGYGRQDVSRNVLVSDGKGHMKEWRVSGDEPAMIAQRCPWALVAVGVDRFRLGQWMLGQATCDCFLLDDGFQHVSLYRDLDMVLCDATDLDGLGSMLPAGRLREPLEAVKEAGAIVMTRAESLSSIRPVQGCIEQVVGESINPIVVNTVPKQIQHVKTGKVRPLLSLRGTSLLVVSGIGNPRMFRDMLTRCGAEIRDEMVFPDHCSYGQVEVDLIQEKIEKSTYGMVVTTEKDAVKLREWFANDDPIWFVSIDVEFIAGEDQFTELLGRVGLA